MKIYKFFNRGFVIGITYSPDYTSNGILIYLGIITIGITLYK